MHDAPPLKVFLANIQGDFLTLEDGHWAFTNERTRAIVFDYIGDRVPQQIELAQRMYHLVLKPVPLDPGEFFESCDGCKRVSAPLDVFFDGSKFLCADCRARTA